MTRISKALGLTISGLLLILTACGEISSHSSGGDPIAHLTVNVGGPSESKPLGKTAFLTVPSQVSTMKLEVTDSSSGALLWLVNQDVSAGDAVTFSFDLTAGGNADFTVQAFNGIGGAGDLLYEGSALNVPIPPGQNVVVDIILGLVGTPPPFVSTDPADNITDLTATFHGNVNPVGFTAVGYFEWGTDTSYGSVTPVQDMGSGFADNPMSQVVNGLTGSTTYHYRAVGENSGNIVFGSDQQFTTLESIDAVDVNVEFPDVPPPTVTTGAAGNIGSNGATLNATVNPNNSGTKVYFEWGLTTAYGNTTTVQDMGSGGSDTFPSDVLSGLTPSTLYHYRAVAFNAGGLTVGGDQSFTTLVSTANVPSSGTYLIAPLPIVYSCDYLGVPVVDIDISEFVFTVTGSNISVSGAPATMDGTVTGSSFDVSGTIPGTVEENYSLTGTFLDADSWSGTFEIQFVGDLSLTTCSTPLAFPITGARI
jgi:hypothetical protein